MNRAILSLCLLLALATNLNAECRFGRAPYFLTHERYDYAEYKKYLEGINQYPIAILWNTPGRNLFNLQRELRGDRVCSIQVVLFNETCVRRGDCGRYEALAGLTPRTFRRRVRLGNRALIRKLQYRAASASAWLNANIRPGTRKLINPLLETQLSRRDWSSVAYLIQPYFPDWEFVWNPIGSNPGAPQPPATISEGHGKNPQFGSFKCIANPDGVEIQNWPAYFRKYRHCEHVFGWGPNDNCNYSNHVVGDPRKRKCDETKDFRSIGAGIRAALGAVQ